MIPKELLPVSDQVQHRIIASLYGSDLGANLYFKGGTMLRVCAFPDYRYSQDIDLEVLDIEAGDVFDAVAEMLPDISSQMERSMRLVGRMNLAGSKSAGAASVEMFDPVYGYAHVKLDITSLMPEKLVLPVHLELQPNHPGVICEALIQCFSLPDVAAAKFNCLCNRFEGRDIFDLFYLAKTGVLAQGWEKYLETRQYYESEILPAEALLQRITKDAEIYISRWRLDAFNGYLPKNYDPERAIDILATEFASLPGMLPANPP